MFPIYIRLAGGTKFRRIVFTDKAEAVDYVDESLKRHPDLSFRWDDRVGTKRKLVFIDKAIKRQERPARYP